MTREGESKVLADKIDGQPIGKVNFVLRDSRNRIWITVSTRIKNWMHALRPDLADGYIAQYVDGAFRIAAEGFHFTNEIRMDAREEYMYVAETTGGCISRMRVNEDGSLGEREIFGPRSLGTGAWPDGIAFDSGGNLWGTMVYSDKLFVLSPKGDLRILLDEGDPEKVGALEKAFLSNQVNEEVLFATGRGIAPWMASVTFGGSDLQTLYIGSLRSGRIPYFRAPLPGLPMVHWKDPK
jgi:gluconolactonase